MKAWQDKLLQEWTTAKSRRDALRDRLHQPQGDISYEQWDAMHRQLHAENKYVSCLYDRVKDADLDA